jgi:hypothetical protein
VKTFVEEEKLVISKGNKWRSFRNISIAEIPYCAARNIRAISIIVYKTIITSGESAGIAWHFIGSHSALL